MVVTPLDMYDKYGSFCDEEDLQFHLTATLACEWSGKYYDGSEGFWLFVEDDDKNFM